MSRDKIQLTTAFGTVVAVLLALNGVAPGWNPLLRLVIAAAAGLAAVSLVRRLDHPSKNP
jgi:hypothetical protein